MQRHEEDDRNRNARVYYKPFSQSISSFSRNPKSEIACLFLPRSSARQSASREVGDAHGQSGYSTRKKIKIGSGLRVEPLGTAARHSARPCFKYASARLRDGRTVTVRDRD